MTAASVTAAPLPIDEVLPRLKEALGQAQGAVLQAPPGAGKTTRVPLALLDEAWLSGRRIVMLEPRRLAARAAAQRMADTLGEPVGRTVGYRIRMESRIGPQTRIEVVTEGILTRMLQDDPALERYGIVLFDEFHERSLNADLGLALCLEAQSALRPDLKLLVMSATLDGGPVAALMGGVPIVTSAGRAFPVETRWRDRPPPERLEAAVADTVLTALAEEEGDILVFLPGAREIRRVERHLAAAGLTDGVAVLPLYGDLPQEAQDRALRPLPAGRRKVVLSTSIAETSLTIEGIRIVVDSGLARMPRFEPRSGMTRLVTVRASQAAADQRRGRAGRLGPGVCYRLWSEASHGGLPPFTPPEILEADLAPLALELAQWGVDDPAALPWMDAPPAAAYAHGRELLRELGAVDGDGRITAHGRAMLTVGLHPRLAHMVLTARDRGFGGLACDVAALLTERDILKSRDGDIRLRVEALHAFAGKRPVPPELDRAAAQRALAASRQLRTRVAPVGGSPADTGLAVALAYPDRIAQRRHGGGDRTYLLSNGRGAYFPEPEPLAAEDWLAVADLDGDRRQARIFAAAPIAREAIEDQFGDLIETVEQIRWEPRERAVLARRQRRLGALVLKDEPLQKPDPARLAAALVDGVRQEGLSILPWTPEARTLRARVAFLRRVEGEEWPDLSDDSLLATLEDWLAPWLDGMTRAAHLSRLDLAAILGERLGWESRRRLDQHAPTHLVVPSGSRIPIDYESAENPILAVRLQELFGLAETPRIAGGRVALTLHLLSPARRPVQVTQDLAGFWASSYRMVKADLKGRYPKHYWPDDPMEAEPTARAKPRKG